MLSNKDFLGLMEGGGKIGLDQVKKWDQQNANEYKKKSQKMKKSGDPQKSKEKQDKFSSYRDRAQERREDANPDYDPQFLVAEKMDVEQTQYLGGDVEHTHLVKGLDYALLRKVQAKQREDPLEEKPATIAPPGLEPTEVAFSDLAKTPQILSTNRNASVRDVVPHSVKTKTALGSSIWEVLRRNSTGFVAQSANVLRRTAFEYNVDIMCEEELPTTVLRSQELAKDLNSLYGFTAEANTMNFVLPSHLLNKLSVALSSSSGEKKKVKPKKVKEEATPPTKAPVRADPINIFDDASGPYVPDLNAGAPQKTSSSLTETSTSYFAHSSGNNKGTREDDLSSSGVNKEDRMAPVVDFLRAQRIRERQQDKLQKNPASIEGSVFGAAMETSGASGSSYDVYPDTADFETYDSDEDSSAGKKKARKGKPASDGASEGPNRAQRRAQSGNTGSGDRKRFKTS